MKIYCSNCGQPLEVPSEYQDHTVECPTCKKSIDLQSSEQPTTQTPNSGTLIPHRGTLILVLGILSLIVSVICCFTPLNIIPVAMALGIPAWIMGKNDAAKITSGQMDPLGAGMTKGGMVCGIIGTILSLVVFIIAGFLLLLYGFAIFGSMR